MTSSVFPDLNVWVALTLSTHEHHQAAWRWYRALRLNEELVFCRFTQIGFLRLLTTESVAKHETLSQQRAWAAYDQWVVDGGAVFFEEPAGLETQFRAIADRTIPAPKEWADSYLAAFARAASVELVTLRSSPQCPVKRSILLEPKL